MRLNPKICAFVPLGRGAAIQIALDAKITKRSDLMAISPSFSLSPKDKSTPVSSWISCWIDQVRKIKGKRSTREMGATPPRSVPRQRGSGTPSHWGRAASHVRALKRSLRRRVFARILYEMIRYRVSPKRREMSRK